MCVIEQAVAGTFPQFVLLGGQDPLVPTHTEMLILNRTIRKQVRFVGGYKQECPMRAAMKSLSLTS